MHNAVLLEEAIDALAVQPGGRYIDGTAGEGGHTGAIVAHGGTVLAIDIDPEQIENLKKIFQGNQSVTTIEGNYADIQQIGESHGFTQIDGILVDFGLSMRQLKEAGKGLSFHKLDEPLDMRLTESIEVSAADMLNSMAVADLYELFMKYSEELYSFEIAKSVVSQRLKRKLATVQDLITAVDRGLHYENVKPGTDKIGTYARIFQALRIAVNDEFTNIKKALAGGFNLLKHGGRMVVITFHSLEDRIVKQYAVKNNIKVLNKKVVRGDAMLRYERSAKMRVLIK